MHNGVPMPSWIDFSLTELCNRSAGHKRACVFCPRINPALYPNQKLHMPLSLVRKTAYELKDLDYTGAVVLCGFGEPLLHPDIVEVVAAFRSLHVEIVTNGDFLTVDKIRQLSDAGCSYFVVSLYDGPQQIDVLKARFAGAGCNDYILRDRWHAEEDDFGLKLTNRGGTVTAGEQQAADDTHPCYYLSYAMSVDWNGDVLLCPQDWTKKTRFGNLNGQTLMQVWASAAMQKRRTKLAQGRRTDSPCEGCNADGCVHGANHVAAWRGEEETKAA
jgi:radical SAM protein with 4Fe4S-binding SPASM domain